MGVVNCTPDSFSDGGRFVDVDRAVQHARFMSKAGAAIIDIGGESTRPGSRPVPVKEELRRVIPVVRAVASEGIRVSVDTMKAEVMRQAIAAGACMVNDVTALRGDSHAMATVAEAGCDVCLMHMQGRPEHMQDDPHYRDIIGEVEAFLEQRIEACLRSGISESRIILDPGIGFGKRPEHNLELLAALPRFKKLGFPLLVGVSRKSFLGRITDRPVEDREIETAAAVSICIWNGADVVRVHDVPAQMRAAKVASAIRNYAASGRPESLGSPD
jgi:dihydropteroate synthase